MRGEREERGLKEEREEKTKVSGGEGKRKREEESG